ncbi:MAG TPA: hypothetical protein VD997_06390 [Phycisphaerales bacterium]|nr:hypothetical protein [Phycisphaerales bacterium]
MEAQATKARCVVWRAKGSAIPAQLERALVTAGCIGVHVRNEFDAMVELCRARAVGELSGLAHVLLIVEPKQLPDIGEVLDIVERYAPQAVLWAYESSPAERIRAVTAEERSAWVKKPKGWLDGGPEPEPRVGVAGADSTIVGDPAATRTVKMNGPRLKLAGEGPGIPAAAGEDGALMSDNPLHGAGAAAEMRDARPGHALTDEELSMLLAIEPDKGQN